MSKAEAVESSMAWLEFRESREGCEEAQKAAREMILSVLDFPPKQQ